ncbi:RNA polymerase sigma factor [Marinicella sp. S1101]|uniref:RNA polymerase sigma factor n=1 Tax=Marinicella marina TaxID=2996016 RepID=UPI002260B7A7|nr:RNA polymerase sigma factor [Marinicella marina]MCX7554531.1 RNA polymerase sigma factor [Marinicella marina]MDJ1141085.1 RNA polymerase sigma factor [Marinicella marina]
MKAEKVYTEYLLMKTQSGEDVMDELVVILSRKIKAYSHKILGQHEAVEDCAQEALLKILNNLQRIKSIKAMHAWMYKVTHTVCLDHLRKYRDKQPNKATDDATDEAVDEAVTQAPTADAVLDVKAAMAQLSQLHRAIIYLFYYEGFTVKEITQVLNKPAGTVKYELFRARDLIKSFLSQEPK